MTVTNARQATFFKQFTIGVILTASAVSGRAVQAQNQADSKPDVAQPRFDSRGDPLPEGALLRIGTTRLQHEGDVWALAVSEDGRFLASVGADKALRIWDAKDGRPLKRYDLPSWGSWALAFSRDGKELTAVSFSADSKEYGGFRHWEWRTGRELSNRRDAATTSQTIYQVALAHRENGELLAAGTSEQDIFLFVPGATKSVKLLKGHTGRVMSLCFTRDAKTLVSLGDEGSVRFWNTNGGQEVNQWRDAPFDVKNLKGNLACFAVSADTKRLAISLPDQSIRLLDASGRELRQISTTEQKKALAFTADGQTLMTGGRGIDFWNTASGEPIDFLGESRTPIRALSLSRDGKLAAFADEPNRLRIADIASGKIIVDREAPSRGGIAFSPDGRFLAIAPADNTIALWDVTALAASDKASATQPARILQCWASVKAFCFAPDGKRLATVEDGNHARIYEVASNKTLRTIRPSDRRRFAVVFSTDGKTLVTVGEVYFGLPFEWPWACEFWDSFTGKELRVSPDLKQLAHTIVFDPNGKYLAAIHLPVQAKNSPAATGIPFPAAPIRVDDRMETIRLWDLGLAREKYRFDDPVARARTAQSSSMIIGRSRSVAAAFSPDGRFFAAPGAGDIVVFETLSGRPRLRLRGHLQETVGLAFTPDGRSLVSASQDSTVLLWDVTGLRTGKKLSGNKEELWSQLSTTDAEKAGCAVWALVDAPIESVAWCRKHLRPVEVSQDRLRTLVADLDHARFTVRDKAAQELAALGPIAEPALAKALQAKPSLEASRRIQALLGDIQAPRSQPDQLRAIRAVEVLEQIGSGPARELLQELAYGADGAHLTTHAREALGRLRP